LRTCVDTNFVKMKMFALRYFLIDSIIIYMDKQSLIKALSSNLDITQTESRILLNTTIEEIINLLQEGDSFREKDFGTFKSIIREKRMGYHPIKQKKMLLPKKRKIKFTASLGLKRLINE